MELQDASVAVRLKIPVTTARLLWGAMYMSPAVMFIVLLGDLVGTWSGIAGAGLGNVLIFASAVCMMGLTAAAAVWRWSSFLGGQQTVSIEGRNLVNRTVGPLGLPVTFSVSRDRFRPEAFQLREYPRDSRDPEYRPALSPRIVLVGDTGGLTSAGFALTLDEGLRACEALNRLIAEDAAPASVRGRH